MFWIETFTGLAFDLDDPKPEQVCIADIAHALAAMARYTGHTRRNGSHVYSVGQHSIHVADIVFKTRPDLALSALLHDAAEAYLGDWSSPQKQLMRRHAPYMLELEARVEAAIAERYGIALKVPEIKQADLVMLATERRDLMQPSPRPHWSESSGYPEQEPLPEPLRVFPASHVEHGFLQFFAYYGGKE